MKTLLEGRAYLEAPRWRDGALYVSDIRGDEVLRMDASGEARVVVGRPGLRPSGLGWDAEGRLLVVAVEERCVHRVIDGELVLFADLSHLAMSIINDMAVDACGRLWIGQAGSDLRAGEPVRGAPLLCVEPDGSARAVGPDLLCANGIVVADDGRTLRVAETFGDRITAFDLGEDGSLSGQRVWASLPAGHAPDGICLDAEGGSWVACPFAQRFVRIAANGTVTDCIPVPGRNAIACTLGGESGATLFMITWEPTAASPADTEARTSRVEATEVGIPTGGQP